MEKLDTGLLQTLKRELYVSVNQEDPNYFWIATISMESIRNIRHWQKSHGQLGNETSTDLLAKLAYKSYYEKFLSDQERFFYFKEVHALEKKITLLDKIYESKQQSKAS